MNVDEAYVDEVWMRHIEESHVDEAYALHTPNLHALYTTEMIEI